MRRTLAATLLLATLAILPGCLQRTLSITTEPPGALVWVNDVEVGVTPLEIDFTYYGSYDVRLRRPGYEPVTTIEKITPPIQERPVIDLFAELWPQRIENRVQWSYTLTPQAERGPDKQAAEQSLLSRAAELRGQLPGSPVPPAESDPAAPVAP